VLSSIIIKFSFFRFIQSGLYIDYILKKFIEVFVKNVFVYSALFLGEKYMIELLTKKVIDSSLFNTNRLVGITELFYSFYFIQLLSTFFYVLTLCNLLFLIF